MEVGHIPEEERKPYGIHLMDNLRFIFTINITGGVFKIDPLDLDFLSI